MRHSYHLPSYKKYVGARTNAYRFSVCPWHYYSIDRHNLSSCTNSSFPLDKSKKIIYHRNGKSIPADGLLPKIAI